MSALLSAQYARPPPVRHPVTQHEYRLVCIQHVRAVRRSLASVVVATVDVRVCLRPRVNAVYTLVLAQRTVCSLPVRDAKAP